MLLYVPTKYKIKKRQYVGNGAFITDLFVCNNYKGKQRRIASLYKARCIPENETLTMSNIEGTR